MDLAPLSWSVFTASDSVLPVSIMSSTRMATFREFNGVSTLGVEKDEPFPRRLLLACPFRGQTALGRSVSGE